MSKSISSQTGRSGPEISRRNVLLAGTALAAATAALASAPAVSPASAQPAGKPNILVIFGDDIGQSDISAYTFGLMGYRTPNIDRLAKEGMMFTDYYAEQSCTAGRSSFITGQATLRTGMSKVGLPGSGIGLQPQDITIATALKALDYATGQFGKNHLGDRNEFLPTVHGFDEFFGNLYYLNAEEEPENPDYPKDPQFKARFGPRGVLKCKAVETDDPTVDPRFAAPGTGIVPPVPGVYWGISNVYYHGEASGEVPIGNNTVALGMKGDIWTTALAAVYVPELHLPGNWTYAVQAVVPIGWTGVHATLGPLGTEQDVAALGDIAFAPVVLGWHNDALNTWFSASLTVTAPTGEWKNGDLAFIGLNYWTFTPAIGFTRLVPEYGLDLSAKLGIDINTKNNDTDYYSGAVAHLDLAVAKNLSENFSVGGLAGFLYQIQDDRGPSPMPMTGSGVVPSRSAHS
ncbi:transporter [Mesorhizobium shangrilense]|uniref:Transporter n=1 Tax=Mesorhizobium shangrilense TaxID=460060 RepID=A0ABV2D5Y1_9HYPH